MIHLAKTITCFPDTIRFILIPIPDLETINYKQKQSNRILQTKPPPPENCKERAKDLADIITTVFDN